jgi:hypothetical protein
LVDATSVRVLPGAPVKPGSNGPRKPVGPAEVAAIADAIERRYRALVLTAAY